MTMPQQHVAANGSDVRLIFGCAHDFATPTSGTTLSGRGADPSRCSHPRQHFVLGAEGLCPALMHDHEQESSCHGAGPMGHNDDDAAARPHAHDGAAERLVALRVEIRVRLIEHDQERIAIERPRQRNALGLTGRKRAAAFADLGLIAFGQAHDQIVHARGSGGCDDRALASGVGSNREMFWATVPVSSSTSCGR